MSNECQEFLISELNHIKNKKDFLLNQYYQNQIVIWEFYELYRGITSYEEDIIWELEKAVPKKKNTENYKIKEAE